MFQQQSEARVRSAFTSYTEESLAEFRDAINNADVPLHTYYIFLCLPPKGTTTVSALSKLVKGIAESSVTRNLQILAGLSKTRKDGGFDLVEFIEDPKDRRYKLYSLTQKGKDLKERMHTRGMRVVDRLLNKED